MKKLLPKLPIPFRMVHKQRIKLNRLGTKRAKAKKYFDSWTCAEPRTPPLKCVQKRYPNPKRPPPPPVLPTHATTKVCASAE